ncbi:hypothetical protein C1H46_038332 [Malus baccata]|uniref:Uncharacterized protein n=1 Tax=Malus baccata TaxID=106549 RepID=A0A540KPQ8_MALBA|nr:hypothetical protein C1H46_038332 [Malus baccata]
MHLWFLICSENPFSSHVVANHKHQRMPPPIIRCFLAKNPVAFQTSEEQPMILAAQNYALDLTLFQNQQGHSYQSTSPLIVPDFDLPIPTLTTQTTINSSKLVTHSMHHP